MRAITISRQYGSGGGEIAQRIAQKLQWQLIDHKIVVRVARQLGITEEEARHQDERSETFVSRVLRAMQFASPEIVATNLPTAPLKVENNYHQALQQVVETAVASGQTVIVGRGSQVLLANRRDVLHVRIVAPLEQRVAYVMRREGLAEAAARGRIQLKDRDRIRYLQSQYRRDPADPLLYDLVLNTSILDLASEVEVICLALEHKARQLIIATGELGPIAGLPAYSGQPGDFRPPASMTNTEF